MPGINLRICLELESNNRTFVYYIYYNMKYNFTIYKNHSEKEYFEKNNEKKTNIIKVKPV